MARHARGGWGHPVTRGGLRLPVTRGFTVAATMLALCTLAWIGPAAAQEEGDPMAIPDTVFVRGSKEPVSYMTTYNRDLSSGNWFQSLYYRHNAQRFSLGLTGSSNTSEGLRGLTTNGVSGDLGGNLTFRATNRWFWSIDGKANMNTNDDDRSKTSRRQNRLQIRTQYSFNPLPQLSGVGILFGELQGDQSLGSRTLPGKPLTVVDSTTSPFDTTFYQSHTSRDSSYTSGLRDGVSGSLRWAPAAWLNVTGMGAATGIKSKTKTLTRNYYAINPGDGATYVVEDADTSEAPNGDQRLETRATYTGLKRSNMGLVLKYLNSDQEYYALSKSGQEHLGYDTKDASFHFDTMPFASSSIALDASLNHSFRVYTLQKNLTSLVNGASATASFMIYRPTSRASLGFQVGRVESDRQVSQNGLVINRALMAMGSQRVSRRLWLDATGSVGLFSRQYRDSVGQSGVSVSDRDDVRGSGTVGAGYGVSERCTTTVHFSTVRAHAVAIDAKASAGNNVQTTYQMDAMLQLRVTRTLVIYQNYQLNANYQIYDYDEPRNTLTRIRKIDTVMSDSLFSFGFLRLTHNFFFQDRGAYTLDEEAGGRTYSVAQELYQQNLSLTAGVRPFEGIVFTATQSLANTRNYITSVALNTNRNRWNLNVGATVDRPLPGEMTLQGSIQRIGEYTERPGNLPPTDVVDYWIAAVQFTKDF